MSETGQRDPDAPPAEAGDPATGGGSPAVRVVMDGLPARRPLTQRALRWALFLAIAAANLVAVALVAAYFWFSRGLPEIPTLAEYRPPIISEVISSDGQIAGEFFEERRKVVRRWSPAPTRRCRCSVAAWRSEASGRTRSG